MELREFATSGFKVLDEEKGIFEAYVSVFGNEDSYGEIVDKGAFTEWLAQNFPRYPKGVWAHNWDEPISATLEAREDDHGLYIKGQLVLEVQRAREAYALMKAGVITDFSFGFYVLQDEMDASRKRHLKKIAIYEYSPVLVGANDQAMLLGIKSVEKKDDDQATDPEKPADAPANGGEPAPAPEKPADETPAADADKPADPAPAADPAPDESGKEKRAEAVKAAIEAARSLTEALEALSAIESAPPAGGAELQVDQRGRKQHNASIKLIIRDARQADVAIGKLLRRAKTI